VKYGGWLALIDKWYEISRSHLPPLLFAPFGKL
jgi:hypothetical protein